MAFDPTTAAPLDAAPTSGFDPSSASPLSAFDPSSAKRLTEEETPEKRRLFSEPKAEDNRLAPDTKAPAVSQDIPDIFSTKTPAARADMLASLKASGLYPSFTAASNVATERFLEKRNGKWVTPTLSRAADKNAGFRETVGAGLAGIGASIASVFGSQNEDLSPTLERIQKQYGLSDNEVAGAWRDLIRQHSSWVESEGDTRVLSDGSLMVNPESKAALDPEKMAELVNSSRTTRANKDRFMANFGTFQNNVASNKLEAYEAAASASQTLEAVPNVNAALKATGGGVPSPSQWGKQTGRMEEFGTPQFVAAYEKEVLEKEGKAGAYVRSIALDGLLGWNKVATTTLGVLGYAGLDSAGQMAEESGRAGSVIGAGKTDTGIVGAVVQEAPSVLTQVVASQLTGGASLALTGSAKAAQVVGEISSIITAGAQSAGQTYYDSRAQGLSHEDSQRQATIAGTSTALVTHIFQAVPGFGGVEDIAAGKGMSGVTVGDLFKAGSKQELWQGARTMAKDLAKAYVGEASEEAIDQIVQTFMSADPETNLADAWKQAWEAGKVGGFMGAGAHGAANITRTPDQILLTPEVAEIAPAAAEAARNTPMEGLQETPATENPLTPNEDEGQTIPTTEAETSQEEARPPLPVQGMPEETVAPESAAAATISPQPSDSLPAGQTPSVATTTEGQPPTLSREELKTTFNLTDEQAEVAESMARSLGLTPERVLLARERGVPVTKVTQEEAVAKVSKGRVQPAGEPLGLDRTPIVDTTLQEMPEDEFLAHRKQTKEDLGAVEAQLDTDDSFTLIDNPEFRKTLAPLQDKFSAVENEFYRRGLEDMHPEQAALELTQLNLRSPDGKVKAAILVNEIQRQGLSEQMRPYIDAYLKGNPDRAEVFTTLMEDVKAVAVKAGKLKVEEPTLTKDDPEFQELQVLTTKKGQAQNKVKGVKFTTKEEARFAQLGQKFRPLLIEATNPANDPVVGVDINGTNIQQSERGTFYTVENGRVRTGPAFSPTPTSSPLTPEAQALLDSGKTPRSVTRNLERIARENGIVVNAATKPAAIIQGLRGKVAPKVETVESAEERLQTAPQETSTVETPAVETPTEETPTPAEIVSANAPLLTKGKYASAALTQLENSLQQVPVTITSEVAETGEKATYTRPASEIFRDLKTERAAYKALAKCLGAKQ